MVVLAVVALVALFFALRSPGDMERQHGGVVDTPARRGSLMAGTFAFMFMVCMLLLGALWVAVNVAEAVQL